VEKDCGGQRPHSPQCPHARAAITWLCRSIEATGNRGSAHSYSPLFGWAKAYPETTGYLIPTLLRYADILQDDTLRNLAESCRNWLLHIQLPNGAWASGVAGGKKPSVFNTAMILGGMASPPAWLLSELSPDGAWRSAAYVPGFVPSYYTYAVWSLLEAGGRSGLSEVPDRMRTALRYYARRFRPDGTVADWGLTPGDWAFTHTIAYTLQGFLESALLLGEQEILEKTLNAADRLEAEFERSGRIAGCYGLGWKGDYSFTCPVGNAQLSIFFRRIREITGAEKFDRAAEFSLREALRFQHFGKKPDTHGALPGSAPFWGPYLRWRYPNWGAKFLLDALAATLPPPVRAGRF